MKRIIVHIILIISTISIILVFAGYYGNVVKAGSYGYTNDNWWQVPANSSLSGNVETMSFGQDNIPNDTITITVTNPSNRFLWVRSIHINEKNHNIDTMRSYIFDANGYFYYSRIVPPGGYGIIRLSTLPADLTTKDDAYDVMVITNAGVLEKSFLIENSTFRNPSVLNSLTPYIVAILFTFYVGIYYYRRFQIFE
jgi:hypothetical protein|tara:strand:+ start:114 stop:701 length:588 start_codon:yes stop_codon:yes gene_type:complete